VPDDILRLRLSTVAPALGQAVRDKNVGALAAMSVTPRALKHVMRERQRGGAQ
jgi:hypothetical protein